MREPESSAKACLLERRWPAYLAILAVLTALSRLGYLRLRGPHVAPDSETFIKLTQTLLHSPSAWLAELPSNQSPLFTAVLAPFVGLAPRNGALAFLVAQAFMNALAVVAVAWLARRGWGVRAGLLAGCMALVLPDLIFWSPYVLDDTLFTLLLLALGVQLTRLAGSRRPLVEGLALAVIFGLLLLTRRAAILLALGIPLAVLWILQSRRRQAWLVVGGYAAPFAVCLAVIAGWNLHATRSLLPEPQRVEAGFAVWDPLWVGTQWNFAGRATSGVDIRLPANWGSLSGPQRVDFARDQTLAFVTQHPLQLVEKTAEKGLVFWLPALPGWSRAHIALYTVMFGALYLLALVGLVQPARARGPLQFALMAAATLTVTSMATIIDFDQRYRLPASTAAVALLAGVGADRVLAAVGRARASRAEPARSLS